MMSVRTFVLGPGGQAAQLGSFLHRPDWPAWSTTLTADGDEATIEGATLVDADELGQEAVAVVIASRERVPIIADEGTKLYSLDREEWVPSSRLTVGESVRVPDIIGRGGTYVTWAKVKRIQRSTEIDRIFMGKHRMWGRLILKRPHQSFATPAAFVHQRATRIAEIDA